MPNIYALGHRLNTSKIPMRLGRNVHRHVLTLAAATLISCHANAATSLLQNGGFETGNLNGWTVDNQAGGSGNWFVTPGNTTALNSDTVSAPATGLFHAVTDQTHPGAHALRQAFTVPNDAGYVELSFRLFVDNYGSNSPTASLDYALGMPNQHARVDLLTATAGPFETGSASVIGNFYLGSDSAAAPNPYGFYRFNISSLVAAGGMYQIRFADVGNQGVMHTGVDDVRIVAEIPEPATIGFFVAGLGLLLGFAAHRRA